MKIKAMKTKKPLLIVFLLSVFLFFGSGCMIIHPQHRSGGAGHSYSKGKRSPGHAKKMSGEKSAKQFAPSHKKKYKGK